MVVSTLNTFQNTFVFPSFKVTGVLSSVSIHQKYSSCTKTQNTPTNVTEPRNVDSHVALCTFGRQHAPTCFYVYLYTRVLQVSSFTKEPDSENEHWLCCIYYQNQQSTVNDGLTALFRHFGHDPEEIHSAALH